LCYPPHVAIVVDAPRMDFDRIVTRLNPAVAWLLRSPLHPVLSSGLALLRVTGCRTGRRYWIPVGYRREGDGLTVLVSRARRKQWWRNYREPAPVDVLLRGQLRHGTAHVVPPGSAPFAAAFEETFRRLPRLGGQFGIRYDRQAGLTPSQVQTLATTGAVVAIELV
jgi:F420H(2)-dependent quinone reductase